MRHRGPLILKFLLTAVLTLVLLPSLARVDYLQALVAAVAVTAVGYTLGDRSVLPYHGGLSAVLVDFVVATLLYRAVPLILPQTAVSWQAAAIVGGAVAVVEVLFHQYLGRVGMARRTFR